MSDSACIATIRTLAADVVQKAKSGHPGAPMGCAPMAHVLFSKIMKFNPKNPNWSNRDRFVLSNGHACALLYIQLHLYGFPKMTMDELKNFRQIGALTPGHPETGHTPGVEVTTGPLGQGIANAVGMAMGQAHMGAVFNKPNFPVCDNHTYVICGDGCLQEGVCLEAISLAGHLGLGNLIVLYDDNHITIDGDTELSFSENVLMRFEAVGWHTQTVADGDSDTDAILKAVENAKAEKGKPSIIKIRTTIGKGAAKEGTAGVHGAPLGDADVANVKKKFKFDPEQTFVVPQEVRDFYSKYEKQGADLEAAHAALMVKYEAAYPDLANQLKRRFEGKLPDGWKEKFPRFTASDPSKATRQFSELALNSIAAELPELVGGSADLTGSNLTWMKCSKDFQKESYDGRYFRFGVREHGMASICNGLEAYGGLIPFCSTFLIFMGYAQGAYRLSALSQHGVIYIMTHDSIGLGEDGPTHQPVETLASLRATPNINVFRPADGNEVSGAYIAAIENRNTPSVLSLTRQGVKNLEKSSPEAVMQGGYIVIEAKDPAIILVATGSEVTHACDAAVELAKAGIATRVVSMPCTQLFDKQTDEYKKSVLIPGVLTISVEAASIMGWSKYSHVSFGVPEWGCSGPGPKVYELYKLTGPHVAERAMNAHKHYAGQTMPSLITPSF